MTSFLGSYKTEISDSLKQVERLGLIEQGEQARVKKNSKKT